MKDSNKVAVARFVLRNKENLAAIRPMGDVLTMATMRFADEVVSPDDLDDVIPEDGRKLEKRELEMAKQLIESLSTDFDAEQVPRRVPRGAAGADRAQGQRRGDREAVSEEPKPTKAPDLMAALEESLAAVKGERGGAAEAGAAPRRRRPTTQGKATAAEAERRRARRASRDREARQSREVDVDGRRLSSSPTSTRSSTPRPVSRRAR